LKTSIVTSSHLKNHLTSYSKGVSLEGWKQKCSTCYSI